MKTMYEVIWIDDEWEKMDQFKKECEVIHQIYLHPFSTQKAGMDELDKNPKKWDAIILDAKGTSFNNCKFLSSQDTLFTSYKNESASGTLTKCYIQGNTDYICGAGNYYFEDCTLAWGGYSDSDKTYAGYITAAKPTATYIFNNGEIINSTVTSGNSFAAGYYGRPWGGTTCNVVFAIKNFNSETICPDGWTDMSGVKAADVPGFAEFSFTIGSDVQQTGVTDIRRSKAVTGLRGIVKWDYDNNGTYKYPSKDYETVIIGGLLDVNSIDEVGLLYGKGEGADYVYSLNGRAVTSLDTTIENFAVAKTDTVYKNGVKVKFSGDEEETSFYDNGIFGGETKYYYAEGVDLSSVLSSDDPSIEVGAYIKRNGIYYVCSYSVAAANLNIQ